MNEFDAGGRRIAFSDDGSGPAIVLLHGLLMDSSMWDDLAAGLVDSYRVIRIDAPGHGDSDPVSVGYDFEDWANDVWRVVDSLGISSTVFCGQSMGGWTSLRCASLRPDRARALILTDTSTHVESPDMKPQYEAFLQVALSDGVSEDLANILLLVLFCQQFAASGAADEWRKKFLTRDPADSQAMSRAVFDRPDVTDLLGSMSAPALVIHGEQDIAIPMERAEEIAQALGAPLHRIPDAGHAALHERPEITTPIVRAFLDGLAP